MIKFVSSLIVVSLLAFATLPASAAEAPAGKTTASSAADEAKAAQALLDRATEYYRANGERAFAAFSRLGEFIVGDMYVYVVGDDGVLKASGGPSIALVGRNVSQVTDAGGKLLFLEILKGAKAYGAGTVEYRWLNREHGKVERKIAYYRKVGDVIVAVGYYMPRAAPQQAKALLAKAVEAIKKDPKAAIASFNDVNGGYIEDDLYVFVVGLDDKIVHAHGAMPRLISRHVGDLRSTDGKPIIVQMIDIAKAKGSGELQYTWQNPVTLKQEKKETYFRSVNGYLVGVGHYMQ